MKTKDKKMFYSVLLAIFVIAIIIVGFSFFNNKGNTINLTLYSPIDNYKKVLEYTDTRIRIQTKLYYVNISGNDLKIQYYTKDEMRVDGVFKCIEFS